MELVLKTICEKEKLMLFSSTTAACNQQESVIDLSVIFMHFVSDSWLLSVFKISKVMHKFYYLLSILKRVKNNSDESVVTLVLNLNVL